MKPSLLELVLTELEQSARRLNSQVRRRKEEDERGVVKEFETAMFDSGLTHLYTTLFTSPASLLAGSSHTNDAKETIRGRLTAIDAAGSCEAVQKGITLIRESLDEP